MTNALKPLPQFIKMLAHDLRWQIVTSLSHGDHRVGELVERLNQPVNLVSYHLKQLREGKLVNARRSDADGRDTYYSLELDTMRTLYHEVGAAIHPALAPVPVSLRMASEKPRILFVCTHNSARSQMAEGLLRHVSDGHVDVSSAGSQPTTVHPEAIRTMDTLGIDIRQQQSKGFDALRDEPFDWVITVCDHAREICPKFPGDGVKSHWGFADPAAVADSTERQEAFMATAQRLQSRIEYLLTMLQKGR